MFPTFKKWFIPSSDNDHRPHFLRGFSVLAIVVMLFILFIASNTTKKFLTDKDSSLAAVVASVLVDLTNFDRAEKGLSGLSVNPILVDAAKRKADDMARVSYFAHTSPAGKTPWHWFREAGYSFSYAGENLAVFFGDSADVERAWMNSSSHRANILNSNFSEIGIATAEGLYQGQKTTFVVQMFGTPTIEKPVTQVLSKPTTIVPSNTIATEGVVEGESIAVLSGDGSVEPFAENVIYEDETFIAVKNTNAVPIPSQNTVIIQTTFFERLIASPYTLLSYAYSFFAIIVTLALIFLIFFEMHIQKPLNISFAVILLMVIGILFFLIQDNVVVASVQTFSQLSQ